MNWENMPMPPTLLYLKENIHSRIRSDGLFLWMWSAFIFKIGINIPVKCRSEGRINQVIEPNTEYCASYVVDKYLRKRINLLQFQNGLNLSSAGKINQKPFGIFCVSLIIVSRFLWINNLFYLPVCMCVTNIYKLVGSPWCREVENINKLNYYNGSAMQFVVWMEGELRKHSGGGTIEEEFTRIFLW